VKPAGRKPGRAPARYAERYGVSAPQAYASSTSIKSADLITNGTKDRACRLPGPATSAASDAHYQG